MIKPHYSTALTRGFVHAQIFDQLFTGLLTFQIVMAVLLALKQFVFTPLLLLPIAVSLVFRVTVARHFDRPLNNLSLHAAADLDRSEEVRHVTLSLTVLCIAYLYISLLIYKKASCIHC